MRDTVFQVFLAGGSEAKAFIKFQEVGLRTDFNRLIPKKLSAPLDTFFH